MYETEKCSKERMNKCINHSVNEWLSEYSFIDEWIALLTTGIKGTISTSSHRLTFTGFCYKRCFLTFHLSFRSCLFDGTVIVIILMLIMMMTDVMILYLCTVPYYRLPLQSVRSRPHSSPPFLVSRFIRRQFVHSNESTSSVF